MLSAPILYVPKSSSAKQAALESHVRNAELWKSIEDFLCSDESKSDLPVVANFVARVHDVFNFWPGIDRVCLLGHEGEIVRMYLSIVSHTQIELNSILWSEWVRAVNKDDSTIFLWEGALYSINQTTHWDVSLTRTLLSEQNELFDSDWEYILNRPSSTLRAYQETTGLVTALLMGYWRSGRSTGDLKKEMGEFHELDNIPMNAGDYGVKPDDLDFYTSFFEDPVPLSENLGIGVHHWSGKFYRSKYNSEKQSVIFWVHADSKDSVFVPILEIPIVDVPAVLLRLCRFSGRSGKACKILIDWYIKTNPVIYTTKSVR